MSNLTLYKNDESRPELDEMLGDYFRSEMPKPWPAFKAPKARRETLSAWSRYRGRLALAACVALLVAGYWSLSGDASHPSGGGLPSVGPRIGLNPKGSKDTPPKVQDGAVNPAGPNPRSK